MSTTQQKFYLSITIVTLTLIIVAGCGGSGDGITTPSSITNQTENTSSNIATIIIKVQWPERGEPGSYKILSSNEEDTLIASTIPDGTKRIDVEVREYKELSNILGSVSIPEGDIIGKIYINVELEDNSENILPATKVLIVAKAYDNSSGGNVLATDEEEWEVKPGNNFVILDLKEDNMVFIPGGTFQMGDEVGWATSPKHTVNLSSFFISKYEVTNTDYCTFLNDVGEHFEGGSAWVITACTACEIEYDPDNPGKYKVKTGYEQNPVRRVTWYGSVAYCNWLSEQRGLEKCYGEIDNRGNDPSVWRTKNGYRLPTEAEWEYACRGGTVTDCYWGENIENINFSNGPIYDNCWFDINSGGITHPVGQKLPNPFGLYDINGNVMEWCNDWFDEVGPDPSYTSSYYTECYNSGTVINPTGPISGIYRILRGGGYDAPVLNYYSSPCRARLGPSIKQNDMGFRIVRNAN